MLESVRSSIQNNYTKARDYVSEKYNSATSAVSSKYEKLQAWTLENSYDLRSKRFEVNPEKDGTVMKTLKAFVNFLATIASVILYPVAYCFKSKPAAAPAAPAPAAPETAPAAPAQASATPATAAV